MKLSMYVAAFAASLTSSLALPPEPPARPAELKELDRLVGTWKVDEFVSKKAEWTPQEVRGSGDVATTKWVMDGWFLEDRKTPANGSEHLGIWHYDQGERAFHYTMFQSPGGNRLDLTVLWNAKAQAFEGAAELPNGVTMLTTTKFPDKNTKSWQATATDADGKVYLDMVCKEVRADKVLAVAAPEGAYVDEAAVSLQGLWLAQSVEVDGRAASEIELKQVRFEFNGNKLVFKIDGPEVECVFKADPKQSPKRLDIRPKPSDQEKVKDSSVLRAIYDLSGDELKICAPISRRAEKYPADFAAPAKSGLMLFVLKKRKS